MAVLDKSRVHFMQVKTQTNLSQLNMFLFLTFPSAFSQASFRVQTEFWFRNRPNKIVMRLIEPNYFV